MHTTRGANAQGCIAREAQLRASIGVPEDEVNIRTGELGTELVFEPGMGGQKKNVRFSCGDAVGDGLG